MLNSEVTGYEDVTRELRPNLGELSEMDADLNEDRSEVVEPAIKVLGEIVRMVSILSGL